MIAFAAKRRRRDIFVESPKTKPLKPRRGGIFRKSLITAFEVIES
jgi:hypothetical protein